MKLIINGEERAFEGVANVAELIEKLGIKGDRVAVELNREIVPRAQWAASVLKDGDKLEVVHFVGGGSAFSEVDVDEIIRLGKDEGARAIQSWVKNNKDSRSQEFEVIYRALKAKSLATAVAFAYGISKNAIPSVALKDMDELRKKNPGLWFSGILHLLSPALLSRAKTALDSGDILCGIQRHYCLGSGPSPLAFMTFSSFERHVRTTRPGDELMLVSVKRLADENLLIKSAEMAIRKFLSENPKQEVLVIRKARSTVDLLWAESDPEDYEELFSKPQGELIALPFVWEQQFFIDAKVPNQNGEVPIGGSY